MVDSDGKLVSAKECESCVALSICGGGHKAPEPAKSEDLAPGFEAGEKRVEQLAVNCSWLIDCIDEIHSCLCPGEMGTWQDRTRQVVAAARRIANGGESNG